MKDNIDRDIRDLFMLHNTDSSGFDLSVMNFSVKDKTRRLLSSIYVKVAMIIFICIMTFWSFSIQIYVYKLTSLMLEKYFNLFS